MQVKCNFLKVNKLNTNPPKATFYCKLQCFLHLRTCLKTPQKSANQNLELSPPPPRNYLPANNSKRYSSLSVISLAPPHPPPSLSVILPSATALSVISSPGLPVSWSHVAHDSGIEFGQHQQLQVLSPQTSGAQTGPNPPIPN